MFFCFFEGSCCCLISSLQSEGMIKTGLLLLLLGFVFWALRSNRTGAGMGILVAHGRIGGRLKITLFFSATLFSSWLIIQLVDKLSLL